VQAGGQGLVVFISVFNITGGELIIILIIALVVLGPDKLPDFVRRAGRVYGEVKRMSSGFKTEFRDAIDEPVREMQDTMNVARSWFDEGIAEVKDLGLHDDVADEEIPRTSDEADLDELAWTESDPESEFDGGDDPNFYDDDGTLIQALPPADASGTAASRAHGSEAQDAEAVDPFGGLSSAPRPDGPAA
jgi:sec-independent protein translocase protein TatB